MILGASDALEWLVGRQTLVCTCDSGRSDSLLREHRRYELIRVGHEVYNVLLRGLCVAPVLRATRRIKSSRLC